MASLIPKWQKPTIYGGGVLKNFLLKESRIVHEVYRPPLICLDQSVQFLVRSKYEKVPKVEIRKSILTLKDSGRVALDRILLPTEEGTQDCSDTVILLLPGLRETTHSPKIISTAYHLLTNNNDHVYVLNSRASCSVPLSSPKLTFAFGEYNHVNEGVDHLLKMHPDKKILLVGACLGSMQAVDYFSTDESNKDAIIGAVCHSCNWHLKKSEMNNTAEPHYSIFIKYLVKDAINRILRLTNEDERKLKERLFEEKNIDIEKLKRSRTIFDVEEEFVAKLINVSGAEEYYEKVSPVNKCHKVKKPVIIINSRDDAAIGIGLEKMDLDNFVKNPNLLLWSTAAGGHVSFVEHLFPVRSYLNRVIPECADILHKFHCKNMQE